jgi:hypothetical protein
MEEEATKIGRVVPYLLFVGAVFLVGFVFVVVNAPLLWEFIQPPSQGDIADLVRRSGTRMNALLSSNASGVVLFAGTLTCLVSGFILNMLSQVVAIVCGNVATAVARLPGIRKIIPDAALFSGVNYFDKNHAALRLWLLANPLAKLQWEWELFSFVLYWGLSTNFLVALLLTRALVGIFIPGLVALTLFACLYSLLRSRIMLQFQNECVEAMRLANAGRKH